ncbi:MAG: hypothetical protein VX460_06165 [Planctomycetota bacterium]|nr:hypothetical protein [Planctomycetota bacterium]
MPDWRGRAGAMETKEILKFVLVIGALPWALPFMKTLARDLLRSFDEDGGLLGDAPSKIQLEEIRRRKAEQPDPLVSEPLAHVREAGDSREKR